MRTDLCAEAKHKDVLTVSDIIHNPELFSQLRLLQQAIE